MLLLLQKRNLLSVIAGIKFAWNIVSGDVISKTTEGVLFQLFKTDKITTSIFTDLMEGSEGTRHPSYFKAKKKAYKPQERGFPFDGSGLLRVKLSIVQDSDQKEFKREEDTTFISW